MFKDTGNKMPNGHVTSTKCRPDITAAFEKDWVENDTRTGHLFDSYTLES